MKLRDGLDIKKLKLVGEGIHGRVYQIDKTTCIKVYKKPEFLFPELFNLLKVQDEPWFPKVIKWGKDYMIRDYIEGIQLDQYLKNHKLTKSISQQLISILGTFELYHFTCRDIWLKNIIVTESNQIKVLDLVHVTWSQRLYPQYMLVQLKELDCKRRFMAHVKKINPNLYLRWKILKTQTFDTSSFMRSENSIMPTGMQKGLIINESHDYRGGRVYWKSFM